MSTRAPRRFAVAVLVTALVGLLGLPAVAAPVRPDPAGPTAVHAAGSSAALRAEVAALTDQVEQLEVAAEVAVEDYNEVSAELDALIGAEIDAQVTLDDADRTLDEDRGAATRRVRALYRSGGTVEIAMTALSGSGFGDAAATYRAAGLVLAGDAATVERARQQVDVAASSSDAVQELRRDRAGLEAQAQRAREGAETALRAREDLLLSTDASLVAAVERERAAAEAAALAWTLAQAEAEMQALAAQAEQLQAAGAPPAQSGAATDASMPAAGSAGATAGPSGGTVPAGFAGPDLDQRAVLDRAAAGAPSPTAAAAIRAAGTRLGLPYLWGATGPDRFDCSGLTMWSYVQAGLNIPRTSRQQYAGLPKVGVDALLPGDLVFYANGSAPSSIHHVSLYLGDGLILTAPRAGTVVKISPVWSKPIYGAVRPAA